MGVVVLAQLRRVVCNVRVPHAQRRAHKAKAHPMSSIYDQHLDKNPANFVALSPVSFVERSAEVFGDLPSVIHGQRRYTWAQTRERSARLAAALRGDMAKGLFFRGRWALPFGSQITSVRQLLERLLTPGVPVGTPA